MISAIVLTKNEEENIEKCLKTLLWSDEIIVIDDNSSDKTEKIAEKLGAKVFKRALNRDFSAQRNFGLEKATHKWVLFVDADERVSPQLRAEIQKATAKEGYVGFYIRRKDFLFGKWLAHGETANVKLLRLARRGAGEWKRRVDEVWEVRGRIDTLRNPLQHFPHPTIDEFLKSINFFSTLNARVFYEEGKKTSFFDWVKPPAKFVQNFIFRLGFLDGMAGFLMALLMSFHSFLVRAKLYLLWKKEGGWREWGK